MGKKIFTMHGPVTNEAGVVMAFSKIHDKIGFPKIGSPATTGFDIENIIYEKDNKKHLVTIEFEYKSKNFILHKHHLQMDKGKKYVLICWEDKCNIAEMLKEFHMELFDIIELSNFVREETKPDNQKEDTTENPGHIILSYNKGVASYDFSAWRDVHCFRVKTTESHKRFAKDHLARGTKVLFAQEGFIIGGFTVVRYEVIDCPKTRNEKEIYKMLLDYPNSLFEHDLKFDFDPETFLRGHIFYKDLFELNVRLDWKKYIKNKQMGNQGYILITKEQYKQLKIIENA